jgi:fluoroquinolone transport system ATP-binding protein
MIEVSALTFTYPKGGVRAVDGVDFEIRRGEIFGLLGPSGAGKSTMQKILIGLLRGYEGRACVFGQDPREQGTGYYERIGVSFELPNHYLKLTALENLRYFASLYRPPVDKPEAVLEKLGLGDDAGMRVSQFSKGMRHRLNLARALLHRPELLFLDEPTAGLDPGNAHLVKELIRTRRDEGATVFLTTHNMTVADELCDRVAFMVDGRIVLIDAPRALKHRYGRRLVDVEFTRDGDIQTRTFDLDGLADDTVFLELLRSEAIHTIHSQETTLEKIFIEVTGKELS